MAEAGVPGYELELWSAILAPANTPPELIARLNTEIVAVIRSPDFTRFMADQGGFVVTGRPDEVRRRIQSDLTTLSRQIKAVNLKADE
jgi:tripartite-type tricarboxylate transporter receptor subunit TctC